MHVLLSEQDAEEELNDFAEFCTQLITLQGKPLILEDFQRDYLRDYFRGAAETTIVQPKKLGKTTVMAAVVLYHLWTVEDAECIVTARTVNQAEQLHKHCRLFIERDERYKDDPRYPYLGLAQKFITRTNPHSIRHLDAMGRVIGRMRVLSPEPTQLEGAEPTLAIIDEYGRFTDSEPHEILTGGLGTRSGQLVVLSNAGSDEDGPLGRVRAQMLKHIVSCDGYAGTYTYCRSPNGGLATFHEFGLAPDADVEDIALVKTANPASWMSVGELERLRASISTEARWRRFHCGIWSQADEAVIKAAEWDAFCDPTAVIPRGAPVFLGLDMGRTHDTTAIVPLYWESEERRIIGEPVVFEPPGNGEANSYLATELAILALAGKLAKFDRARFMRDHADLPPEVAATWADTIAGITPYQVHYVTHDPTFAGQLAERMKRKWKIEFPIFEQKSHMLVRADAERFMGAFRKGYLVHNGNETLRAHVLNAVEIESGNGGEYFYFGRPKKGHRKPMDALRAVSMAHDTAVVHGGVAMTPEPAKRGFTFF